MAAKVVKAGLAEAQEAEAAKVAESQAVAA